MIQREQKTILSLALPFVLVGTLVASWGKPEAPIRLVSTPLSLNRASLHDFETIDGLGRDKAIAIYYYRLENGPYKTYEDLLRVPRLGKGTLEKMKPYCRLE